MSKNKTVRILSAAERPGMLYQVMSEDEMITVFNTYITAHGVDGVTYLLKTHSIPGFVVDDEGIKRPNFNYKAQVSRFLDRVEARGRIDLRYWTVLVVESPAERDAYELRCEADERAMYA